MTCQTWLSPSLDCALRELHAMVLVAVCPASIALCCTAAWGVLLFPLPTVPRPHGERCAVL